ncbi:MAG: TlpA disulfide reductase family protein, partial [Bacteroidales bacterium]
CTFQAEKKFKKFTIKGEIVAKDSSLLVLRYVPEATVFWDTTVIQHNKFTFSGQILEPTKAEVTLPDESQILNVYLEPGVMEITIDKSNLVDFEMTGSRSQKELTRLIKMEEPVHKLIVSLKERNSVIADSIKNSKSEVQKQMFESIAEEIGIQLSKTRLILDSIQLKFILDNPKSYVSVEYLQMIEANEVISLDSLKSIFYRMNSTLQNSKWGRYIKEDIRRKENTKIGAQAPDFKAIDLRQQTITISQFRGKNVVLLNFWASWCIPCRQEIPNLKTFYKKYHSRGLEIVAVSTDWIKDKWITAVEHYSTELWINISVAQNYAAGPSKLTNDDIYKNYFVQRIPFQILIDTCGKIIGKWGGGLPDTGESLHAVLESLFEK